MSPEGPWQFVVISHSHWDREWYVPFQTYRIRLVGLMDGVLDLLSNDSGYKHFMTDGQTVVLEDYLRIRPDRREVIERLVREGRLLIGPWYVQPDEFLSGGEALIRNFQRGMRLAKEFGGPMLVGYSPDAFGHIAHLPAILHGLGIDSAVVWRGLGAKMQKSEFIWQAPDGSEVLTLHLPLSYGAAWPLPRDAEMLRALLSRLRQEVVSRATTRYVAVMNGTDHVPPQPDLASLIENANDTVDDGEFIHGTLPQLVASIKSEIEEKGTVLSTYRGEMRSPQRAHLLPGSISARMWVKQRSQQCEDLIIGWLEPLTAWHELLRKRLGNDWRQAPLPWGPFTEYPSEEKSLNGLVREAWRQLLLNQSHDPIYGSGVDAVYVDVVERFDSCEQIAGDLVQRMLTDIAAQTDTGDERGIAVFNPLVSDRTDFVTFDWPVSLEGKLPVEVVDPAGVRHPCQIVSLPPRDVPAFSPPQLVKAGFLATQVPGNGYKSYRVVEGEKPAASAAENVDTIENEFFAVSVDSRDGSVNVRDKRNGREFRGLNRLVDEGDRGDEYNYSRTPLDRIVDSPLGAATVGVVENGPARWTLQIEMAYSLPAAVTRNRQGRSRREARCHVRSLVSLYPGLPRIDFRLEFDNRVRDHRLRVHFPTGVQTEITHAEQHFGVISRPIALPEADGTWLEQPVGTFPQKAFVDVYDGRYGLLLANRGLPEYEALPGADGVTLALTLLRCVGWLSRPDFPQRRGPAGPTLETPGAQCLGRHVFEYSIVPHDGGWENAFEEAHRFARPLRAAVATGSGELPPAGRLIEVQPSRLVVSGVKVAEDGRGVVMRLYNVSGRTVRGRVRFGEPHGRVEFVNLNEEPLSEATVESGWVQLRAKRNEIVSLMFYRAS
jgi:mannosylglycerate hydrolase